MPIYEYRCESCDHEFEEIQKLSDAALTDCPACGEPQLRKLISAAGFQLKGSGWYATDFKNSGKKAKTEGDANTDSGTGTTEKSGTCGGGSCSCAH